MALLASEHVNQYGNLYVLIGRNTFSAAQSLVNDLEQYANVIFVGDCTGANPSQYGDPNKIRLATAV